MKDLLLVGALVISITMGCRSKSNSFMAVEEEITSISHVEEMAAPPPPSAEGLEVDPKGLGEQKLIKTARQLIEVGDYEQSRAKIDSLTKRYKAWISSENMSNYDYRLSNSLTIRVPATSLDELIQEFQTLAKRVESQSVETLDVTEEFIDIESRLKNQRSVEQTFISLLRRTDSIEQILQIESKLAEVRGEIESIEGRLKYLGNRVVYSTINLHIYQKVDFKYEPEQMESFWEQLKTSTHKGWSGFIIFLLFLFRLWPLWILLTLGWLAFNWYRRKYRSSRKENKKKLKIKVKDRNKETPKTSKPDSLK